MSAGLCSKILPACKGEKGANKSQYLLRLADVCVKNNIILSKGADKRKWKCEDVKKRVIFYIFASITIDPIIVL